jgi:cyclophilin family peptidyl-prolyl cis-trans isomerase
MIRRAMIFLLLAGLVAGCQTEETATSGSPEEVESKATQEEKGNTIMILMKTSKGDIKLELDKEKAPKTVENFIKYVEAGHYAGTIFHRVIDGFMIQGGGFDENMSQKPAPDTVENEAANGLQNDVGTIAMARTADPHSASAQFFINVSNNAFLNHPGQDGWGYCVFGKVVDGMDVVNEIKGVPTENSGFHQNVPTDPVIINEVVVTED